jgi:hypothetical protein
MPAAAGRRDAVGAGLDHEIEHHGFRILAHRQARAVRLLTRNGIDLADCFPLAAAAILALPIKLCVVDAEAIVCDDSGMAVFDLIRGHGRNGRAILCAFDLLEVNGEDIRHEPIEDRKRRLVGLLRLRHDVIALNEHYEGDGAARASYRSGSAHPIGPADRRIGSRSRIQRRPARSRVMRRGGSVNSATMRANAMDKQWEDMSADEKLESLRLSVGDLRSKLLAYAADFDVSLRQLNDRLARLEDASKK